MKTLGWDRDAGRDTFQRVLAWVANEISRSVLKAGFVAIAFLVTGKSVISALAILGTIIGLHGVAALSPLPFAESALIFGYTAVCSLCPNGLVRSFLRAPAPEKAESGTNGVHALLEQPS